MHMLRASIRSLPWQLPKYVWSTSIYLGGWAHTLLQNSSSWLVCPYPDPALPCVSRTLALTPTLLQVYRPSSQWVRSSPTHPGLLDYAQLSGHLHTVHIQSYRECFVYLCSSVYILYGLFFTNSNLSDVFFSPRMSDTSSPLRMSTASASHTG